MSAEMLETLWKLCDRPQVRESLMIFIANASHVVNVAQYERFTPVVITATTPGVQAEALLSPAFTDEVCHAAFLDLFCSSSFNYEDLGDSGYRSFQIMFKHQSHLSPSSKKIGLDALWRLCLTAVKDSVASHAMKDLLAVYVVLETGSDATGNSWAEPMATDENNESFRNRIFQCLERVKSDLDAGAPSAERSIERCMRILNAAIGRVDAHGHTTPSTLARLALLTPNATLDDAAKCLPHGMRGQACYRRIGIVAKRQPVPNQVAQLSPSFEGSQSRQQSALKFPLDVHPLETLHSLKIKVASKCKCPLTAVKIVQINGRARSSGDPAYVNVQLAPDDTVMDELGVVQGCEPVFVFNSIQNSAVGPVANTSRSTLSKDLSSVFFSDDSSFSDRLFSMLLGLLESLPWKEAEVMSVDSEQSQSLSTDIHKLVWDLLLAMPTNPSVATRVKSTQFRDSYAPSFTSDDDAMDVDPPKELWSQLLDAKNFDKSVYVLLTIDAFLQPAPEALSVVPSELRLALEKQMIEEAHTFRRAFIDAGGFDAVVRFFSLSGGEKEMQTKARRGNAVALRILKSCLFGNVRESLQIDESDSMSPDDVGAQLLDSLSDVEGLLKSLATMVVEDQGISSSTITDVLRFLRLLFRSPRAARIFVSLPDAEKFLVVLLMWEEGPDTARTSSSVSAATHVRKGAHDLILQTATLADRALPWLINTIEKVDVSSESTTQYFDVLEKLVSDERSTARSKNASDNELRDLATIICKKLVSCPRPGDEIDLNDISTGVLCGCLTILRALIEHGGGSVLRTGVNILLTEFSVERWSDMIASSNRSVLSRMSSPFSSFPRSDDATLIDLMGAIFDGFLTGSSSASICCDKESRQRGFQVVAAAARACKGGDGYKALVSRIDGLVSAAAPKLRHRWGQFGASAELHSRNRATSKYSGLRNQGCTCYMNSVLQQLFMMPELRASMCSAPLPVSLRSVGSGVSAKGAEIVGKKISLLWESNVSYDAMVESFDKETGMHTIRYCPIQVATVGVSTHQQVRPEAVARLPPSLPDEFVLSEGRPGKETGAFEIVRDSTEMDVSESKQPEGTDDSAIKETEEESLSRHLLEEVQRTFIHLEEGSRGRCFDPKQLVEACTCLKLEFDVWQQNDASEFATKLLDRLEISLKRWAPSHFRYMDHTFGLKQTKQKVCKKCGLKTSREEKLLNIDCQIRGKSDIHEALASLTDVEIMEGSNQVYCDNCKENTDTILKSAISSLPNMLILSLKRFDLDYNTFETVKLNGRCAFGQTLNMKQYSLEALEAMERSTKDQEGEDSKPMDTEEDQADDKADDPLRSLPDEDYEYHLAGVLVHSGVAQGGHYYSFIKDRSSESKDKWYRFDDEDVTPFDPASIETECFGGKVRKETKWPNGNVSAVEQEQFANALMLFYEKVKPTDVPPAEDTEEFSARAPKEKDIKKSSGYDSFEPDVRRSNATHRWQSFLFDAEFQTFLKGMLGACRLSHDEKAPETAKVSDSSWHDPLVQMLLSFVFDVMLYSSDCSSLGEWSKMLEEILSFEKQSAVAFVHKLATKTREVSGNWLRTYLLDCPDQGLRSASAQIFVAAIKNCTTCGDELKCLDSWVRAWNEQLSEISPEPTTMTDGSTAMPCSLSGKWSSFEDVQKIDGGGASSLGIILSFLNVLLEAMPRCWRFSSELCLFIRDIAATPNTLRKPMIDALIPPRLIALICRERIPAMLVTAFPGASVSPEVANTQVRAEMNPNAHVLPMSGNQVLNASDMNSQRGPNYSDYTVMLEALACLAGLPGCIQAELVRDSEEMVRGRPRFSLSEKAEKALHTVFEESCAREAPGMGQREIEVYLRRIGIETGPVSQQKIHDMLSKYPTTSGKDEQGDTFLSLEGFLAYYRDNVQSNELKLRHDLHTFGFRPDLSRRSHESRLFRVEEQELLRSPTESVAFDVAETFKESSLQLGSLANLALSSTVHIYAPVAYNVSEQLLEYLGAAATYRRETESLIDRALQTFYIIKDNHWGGNDGAGLVTLLQIIASVPGDDQQARIGKIMLSTTDVQHNADLGCGVLQMLRRCHHVRQTNQYPGNDVLWAWNRYTDVLKKLHATHPIARWMEENRSQWTFVERDLAESRFVPQRQNLARIDHDPREYDDILHHDHNTHSDSDMAGMHDSEEEDEDSHFNDLDLGPSGNDGPTHVVVQGAGNPAVDGTYSQDGFFESACRYVKDGYWGPQRTKFYIFLCNVSNNTKHWYISIVPYGSNPGTSSDIDFYTAPMTETSRHLPPQTGWVKTSEGKDPVPTLDWRVTYESENESPERVGTGTLVEDENDVQDAYAPPSPQYHPT
jgi:ubiquitin carboxyl-terminal hydrolase 9/24